jgi:hypothetical protein
MDLFKESLEDEDTYIYLSAINGLVACARLATVLFCYHCYSYQDSSCLALVVSLVHVQIVSAQIVLGTNCIGTNCMGTICIGTNGIGHKLYRAQMVSGTNGIG